MGYRGSFAERHEGSNPSLSRKRYVAELAYANECPHFDKFTRIPMNIKRAVVNGLSPFKRVVDGFESRPRERSSTAEHLFPFALPCPLSARAAAFGLSPPFQGQEIGCCPPVASFARSFKLNIKRGSVGLAYRVAGSSPVIVLDGVAQWQSRCHPDHFIRVFTVKIGAGRQVWVIW